MKKNTRNHFMCVEIGQYFIVTNLVVPDTLFGSQVNLNVSCGSVFAAQSEFICLEFNVISYLTMIYNLFSPSYDSRLSVKME